MPKRTTTLLKIKKLIDSEAKVVGYVSGRRTDKGSKLLGKMGALIVDWHGIRFELSGFTDEERMFESDSHASHAAAYPGKEMPSWVVAHHFPIGTAVTFRYRELSDLGVPKEARYWRTVT
jgi:ATP-dependent DNA ligase